MEPAECARLEHVPPDDNPDQYYELISAAKENALALCLAQLGEVNAMGNAEALRVLEEIGNDADRVYALIRVMASAITVLAGDTAEYLVRGAAKRHDAASELIRIAITELEMTAWPKPD